MITPTVHNCIALLFAVSLPALNADSTCLAAELSLSQIADVDFFFRAHDGLLLGTAPQQPHVTHVQRLERRMAHTSSPVLCIINSADEACIVQIHLGLSGTNSFWVMWATGTGKVCVSPPRAHSPRIAAAHACGPQLLRCI